MSYLRPYWVVLAFSVLLVVGALIFFVRREARDGILSNAPWELVGIAVSALVTVFVVERIGSGRRATMAALDSDDPLASARPLDALHRGIGREVQSRHSARQ